MGVIKTALEIALEKTESVKSDKTSIELFEAKQRGKKLAGDFLSQEANLEKEIKNTPDNQKESLMQGIFDVLISKISLPAVGSFAGSSDKKDEKLIEAVGNGLQTIIKNKQFSVLYQQLMQIFSQYLQEASNYEKAIRQQYAPKLRQKEEELSRRFGREVRIDPMQDPEFVAIYNQHMNALKGNYEGVVDEAKDQIRSLFNEN
jgi:hypothetical protein